MKPLLFGLLLVTGLLVGLGNKAVAASEKPKAAKDEITVQGCVGRSSGDYILIRKDPAISYELQATGKLRLRHYLGQQVEVSGKESPTMSSSSDALNKTGSAAPVTITVSSIKTIDKECSGR